jgi:ribosomal-protein-alanine N-acetyltransferase
MNQHCEGRPSRTAFSFGPRPALKLVVLYRLYDAADFDALYAIEEVCFRPPLRFSRRYIRQLVENPDAAAWIAEEDSQMAGFVVVDWARKRGLIAAYVQTLEVLPAYRGKGIAAELLRRGECSAYAAGATQITLHVDENNATALHLYEKSGYIGMGRVPNYYPTGSAALVFGKPLQQQSG